MSGPGTAVRVTPSRRHADEWAVVLAAADIRYWIRRRLDGWALIVPAPDADAAREALEAYDRENAGGNADDRTPVGSWPGATAVGVSVALLLIASFAITGSGAERSVAYEAGSADARRMLAGEWWRAVTALTLHTDVPHLLGNAVAGVFLVTAVVRRLGPGVGLWLLLLAGAGGNVLTAVVHGAHHASVGASTTIFGAFGILAALRLAGPTPTAPRKSWVVAATCLALLAFLGTGPNADLLAHLFGLLVGAGFGVVAGRAGGRILSASVQWLLAAAAGVAVLVAWRLAL